MKDARPLRPRRVPLALFRRFARGQLQAQNERYLDLVTALPTGIYRLRVHPAEPSPSADWEHEDLPRYEIEFVSDRFCAILGVSREAFQAG